MSIAHKKRIIWALMLLLCLLLGSCKAPVAQEEAIEGKSVYASFFPLYTLTEGLLEGVPNMYLTCLVQPQDGCLRSYQLSEWDQARLLDADLCILGGRGLESFSFATGGSGLSQIVAMEGLALIDEGNVSDDDLQSHLSGENPWAFLSVEAAMGITEAIAEGMATLDPDFHELYDANLDKRLAAMEALMQDMSHTLTQVDPAPVALLHEGLIYLADELGLLVAARIDREPGSTPYEADMEEMLKTLEGSGARCILLERQAPDALKNRLVQAGFELALIDTLSTFPGDADAGHYERAMRSNAQAIADAFRRLHT